MITQALHRHYHKWAFSVLFPSWVIVPASLMCCVLLLSSSATAQGTTTVIDSGFAVFSPHLTKAQVRDQARDELFRNAVVKATGIRIVSETFGSREERNNQYNELFSEVNRSTSFGRVVDFEVLDEGIVTQRFGIDRVEGYRIVARCDVAVDREDPDPGFQLSLRLNQDIYRGGATARESDEVIISAESTLDAYITIFSISGDSVSILYPNKYEPGVMHKAGETLEFPSMKMRTAFGLHYRTVLPGEQTRLTESIFALATRDYVPLATLRDGTEQACSMRLVDIYRWVSSIKPSRRVEAHRIFEIRRKD